VAELQRSVLAKKKNNSWTWQMAFARCSRTRWTLRHLSKFIKINRAWRRVFFIEPY